MFILVSHNREVKGLKVENFTFERKIVGAGLPYEVERFRSDPGVSSF